MSQDGNRAEIPDSGAPSRRESSDESTSMSREQNGPRGRHADLRAPHTADDALLRWDELDEQLLRMLDEDPDRGWRLRKLQDADGWLRQRATEALVRTAGPALLVCPPPEDLYDFGQGPGAGTLTGERRTAIDRHLATCLECERFVATLATAPPSPIVFDPPVEAVVAVEAPDPDPIVPLAPSRRHVRLLPVLTAAAAVVIAFLALRVPSDVRSLEFPTSPVLRGAAGGPLYFPRDRVLLPSADLAALFPALEHAVRMEVEPQSEVSSYRFELSSHSGRAFGETRLVDRQFAATNEVEARAPRTAGHFTWDVWVERNGFPHQLGTRDFHVAADAGLEKALLALAEEREPERTLAAVRILHAAGYVTDARELARTLPPSAERDRYLSQSPGR